MTSDLCLFHLKKSPENVFQILVTFWYAFFFNYNLNI